MCLLLLIRPSPFLRPNRIPIWADSGGQVTHTGTTPNNYLYRGEQYDPDLGLYSLRARYYNPQTGGFLSRDPAAGSTYRPKTLHKYLYVGGDPIDGIDPTGRDLEEVEEGDIASYDSLTYRAKVAGRAGDLEFHHIIPARFSCLLGISEGAMLAVAVDPATHQVFDNQWAWSEDLEGDSCEQALEDVVATLEEIYEDDPDILSQIQQWLAQLEQEGAFEY